VRSLEANNQNLVTDNGRMWDENQNLHAQLRRMTNELGYVPQQNAWTSYAPDASFSVGTGYCWSSVLAMLQSC